MKKVKVLFITLLVALSALALFACSGSGGGDGVVALTTPTNLTVDATAKTVTWDVVANASGYTVDVDGTAADANTNSFSLASYWAAGNHAVKVKAKGDGTVWKDSAWSQAKSYTVSESGTVAQQLSAPTDLTVNESAKTVTWNTVANASGYSVQIDNGAATDNGTATTYALANYWTAGNHTVKVKAIGDGTNYTDSDWAAKTYTVTESPQPQQLPTPAGLNVNAETKTLTWNAVANAYGYTLDVDNQTYTASGNSYSLSSLTNPKVYAVKVRADGNGTTYLTSGYSAPVNYTVTAQLDTPAGLLITGTTLTWNAVANAGGYDVQVDNNAPVTLNGGQTASYSLSSLTDNSKTYTLKVKALGDGTVYLHSEFSAAVEYIGDDSHSLKNAEGFTITGTTASIKLYNATSEFDFNGKITVSAEATWIVTSDPYGVERPYPYKVMPLNSGDNTVYLFVTGNGETTRYTLAMRRRPIHTVSFDMSGGTSVSSQQIEEDSCAVQPTTAPESLLRTGYTFADWNFDFNAPIVGNTQITPNWTARKYTVTYDFRGGNGSKLTDEVAYDGAYNFITPTAPQTYLVFGGWYASVGVSAGTKYTGANGQSVSVWKVAQDVTVYAYWLGLDDLQYTEINGGAAYSVSKGTATFAEIYIPDEYNGKSVTAVGSFANYTNLTKIIVPNSVTGIGSGAFYGCIGLTSITIPFVGATLNGSSNTHFGYIFGASSYSNQSSSVPSSLKTVVITGGNSIGTYVFYGCSGLTSITIPNGVTSIATYAFYGCSGLTGALTIPNGVTSIATYAFYGCSGLTGALTIPSGVTSIGGGAFNGCSGLTEINFNATAMTDLSSNNNVFSNAGTSGSGITVNVGANVTKIPAYLFQNMSKITSVVFAQGSVCASIGNYAFYNCSGLTGIEIPSGVTSIGNYAFYGCSGLTEINFNATAMTDLSSNNYVFYNAGTSGSGITVNVGANVTKIPAYLFYPYSSNLPKITSVVFAQGSVCASIGTYAFYGCSGLTGIEIPSGATSIGTYAFYGCSGLTEINFNATAMTDLSSNNNVFSNAGTSGSGITVNVGANVTKIPAYLFQNMSKITSVVFAQGSVCASIGAYAFYNCSGLTGIEIPSGVTSIGNAAFAGCSGLTGIEIPSGVTSIGTYAFYGCSGLTGITFGANSQLTSIGERAFYECSGLTGIEIPSGVTSIGNQTFYGCSGLTGIEIPSGVTSIGYEAFSRCSGLTEINFNATAMTDLSSDNRVFYNAGISGSGITVNVGANVTKIPAYLFQNMSKITSVVFAQGSVCASIGQYAFYVCSGLAGIEIPSSVTSIGNYSAFYGCSGLTSITVESGNTVYKSEGNCLIQISNNTLILGCNNSVIPDYVTSIGDWAFYGCSGLTGIVFGANSQLTSIGERAFYNCSGLTGIEIPSGVTSIGNSAFYNCSGLTSIAFGANSQLTSIGYSAFQGCSKLTSIVIPSGVTSISSYAFSNCSGLTIYAETASKPSGWDSNWNSSNRPVYWGGAWHYDETTGLPVPN
ncbi:hypothetical protein FACS1894211_13030 [Clostridia bacterium]|nr:hypothetical protein FACS1894211_13030 [Clostridia bacterium]